MQPYQIKCKQLGNNSKLVKIISLEFFKIIPVQVP